MAPAQRRLAGIFHNPEDRQADLTAMRVTGKRQMRSGWYRREPHRIMGKHNVGWFGERPATPFGSRCLHACIRNAHDVDDATVENHGSLFIIENDNAVPSQDGNNFFRAVNVIMISENSVSATGSVNLARVAAMVSGGTRPPPNSCMLTKSPPNRARSGLKV